MTTETLFDLAPHSNSWHTLTKVGFDLETTSRDPRVARIVSAAIVIIDSAGDESAQGQQSKPAPQIQEWLVNPGVEIPAETTEIHGITTAHAVAHGIPSDEAVAQILRTLTMELDAGSALVVMNAPYDFTVLKEESARHGLDFPEPHSVIDPFVIDKQVDKFRRGKRRLGDLCAHYGVPLVEAHSAAPDAEAAVRVAEKIAQKYPEIQIPIQEIHSHQISWKAEQAADLEQYLRRTKPDAVVTGNWPL